jgi:hypothetical protein
MNNILDTITVAIDGESVLYFVAQTTAPIAYDGFGTISVFETSNVRVVLIREEHFNWQNGRYNSGLYYATHYPKTEIVQELWKRLAGGSQIVADKVREADMAERQAEKEAKARTLADNTDEERDELEKLQETVYRGWTIIRRHNGRYSVSKDGHQSRHNLKNLFLAKLKVDAIAG